MGSSALATIRARTLFAPLDAGGRAEWLSCPTAGSWAVEGIIWKPWKTPGNAPGSETGPGPQLVTWGKSTILSVDAFGFKFEMTANSAKHIPFDWKGP